MAQVADSPELALADFRQTMLLDPGNRAAAQNMMHVLSDRLDRNDEALALAQDVLAKNPFDARALLTRAVLSARRGDAPGAAADVAAALEIDDSPLASLQAAGALAQLSEDDEYRRQALKLLAKALGAKPALAAFAAADPDLAPLRSGEEFQQIINAANVIRSGGDQSIQKGRAP
jgi:tetratricopeptide (TPR) repeat protein